jgi:DNA-binding CsgD family transcriptional regulator
VRSNTKDIAKKTGRKETEVTVCPHCGSVLPRPVAKRDENEPELTPRQKAVLGMIARGMTNTEIAEALGISRRTAEFHRMMVMEKLRLDSTAALTLYAASCGLI